MVGIRAWVVFSRARFGRIACGIVTSALLTMLALMQTPGDKCWGLRLTCAPGSSRWASATSSSWPRSAGASAALLLSLGIGAFSLGELGMALKFMATRGRCAMHS